MHAHRRLTVGLTALLAVGAAAGGAAAQQSEVTVSADSQPGSRQFFVEDLTGTTLTALDLGTTGSGQPFQVRVADNGFLSPSAPFTASAEMTHLYRKGADGTLDYGTRVGSDKVGVSYIGAPDVAGVSVGAIPTLGLTGALPTCDQLGVLLPAASPLRGGSLFGSLLDPLNILLASLGLGESAKPLCTALGGTSTTPLPVDQADAVLVQLQEQLLQPALDLVGGLPLDVTGSTETGTFDAPSFLGAGAGDPAASTAAATKRKALGGNPNALFDLDGLLGPILDGQPLFGADGLTEVTTVVGALQNSPDTGVAALGTALAGLSAADQTGVLSGLTNATGPVATLLDAALSQISGTYRSFPRLDADLSNAPAGDYTGTMTVTFVQQ